MGSYIILPTVYLIRSHEINESVSERRVQVTKIDISMRDSHFVKMTSIHRMSPKTVQNSIPFAYNHPSPKHIERKNGPCASHGPFFHSVCSTCPTASADCCRLKLFFTWMQH